MTVFSDTSQARTQLTQHQERQSHIRHLYKLALSLGADLTSTVQQSVRWITICHALSIFKKNPCIIWTSLPESELLHYLSTEHVEPCCWLFLCDALSILIDLIETATNDHPFPPSLCSKHVLVLSVQQLHEKLLKLERGSTDWIVEANKCEESLISNVHFCLHKEEISEVSIVCVCQLVRV